MAGNVAHGTFKNLTYQSAATLLEFSFNSSKTYLIQLKGSFGFCRKSTAPDEGEGFFMENASKFIEYNPADDPTLYVKSIGDSFYINVDESA